MELESFVLCKRTSVEKDRISVHDIYNTVDTPFLPIKTHLEFFIRMRFETPEFGLHHLDVIFLGPLGKKLPRQQGRSFNVHNPKDFNFTAGFTVETFVLDFPNMVLPVFGVYHAVLSLDAREIGRLPYIVAQTRDITPIHRIEN